MCFCGVWFLLSNAFASRCWTIPRLLGPRNAQSRRKFVSCSFVVGLTVFHIVFSFKWTYVQSPSGSIAIARSTGKTFGFEIKRKKKKKNDAMNQNFSLMCASRTCYLLFEATYFSPKWSKNIGTHDWQMFLVAQMCPVRLICLNS